MQKLVFVDEYTQSFNLLYLDLGWEILSITPIKDGVFILIEKKEKEKP